VNWYEEVTGGEYCACRCWMNDHTECSNFLRLFVIDGHTICLACLKHWREGLIVSLVEVVRS
jgi:hypothetical protein